MKTIKTSVIIPVRTITPYVRETVVFLGKQTEKNFEIIIVTDKKEELDGTTVVPSGEPTPAYKRNLGSQRAKGIFLAFLDDDSYPESRWLENSLKVFAESPDISAVCGPTLTPPNDNTYQRASGCVWASWFGSGGAGVYRNRICSRREVNDFPSVNLLVRKDSFKKVEGFDTAHWPGEDTKLCLDLIKLGTKIIYDPSVLVYHHRRPVFVPHLKQISRYAIRRGHFAKIFPETSLLIGYLIPSLFTYGLVIGGLLAIFFPILKIIYFSFLVLYASLLMVSGWEVLLREKNIFLFILTMAGIFLTHLVYGFLFPFGYFQKHIKTVPHKIDTKKGVYLGG